MKNRALAILLSALLLCMLLPMPTLAQTRPPLMDGTGMNENGRSPVSLWFAEHYPDISVTVSNVLCANSSTEQCLAALAGENPPDILYLQTPTYDPRALRDSGLLCDLNDHAAIAANVRQMHMPIQQFLSRDGAGVCFLPNFAMPTPHFWCEEAFLAAGYTAADAPQTIPELLTFAEGWLRRVELSEAPNIRLNTFPTGRYAMDNTRYALWLLDLLKESVDLQAHYAGRSPSFATPEFISLAERARAIGLALARAEKRPDKQSLSLFDSHSEAAFDSAHSYRHVLPMRLSSDQPSLIRGKLMAYAVRKGSPYEQELKEYLSTVMGGEGAAMRDWVLYQGMQPGVTSGAGRTLSAEWLQEYDAAMPFYGASADASMSFVRAWESLSRQFANGKIAAETLAQKLNEALE